MQLEDFLKQSKYFSLGHLPTESFHPDTENLSDWILDDLPRALATVQKIDLDAVQVVKENIPLIRKLADDIDETFKQGSRVFLSGCGATGRLALTLESIFRQIHRGTPLENKIQALMAGGDFALVKSVENFEDFPDYGDRHLKDLGFQEGDLLIAITEGGETPYVIGTVQGALKYSTRSPWFVFCNPKDLLCQTVERSRTTIENPRVHSLELNVGPMALSGSTRLQAATAQMFAVGVALTKNFELIDLFLNEYRSLDLHSFLAPVIDWEADAYLRNEVVLYQTSTYPIAVLTDTTERSPTFSLTPFENSGETSGEHSLCYLSIPDAHNALQSWTRILNRLPIGLNWPELTKKLDLDSILEFDFGREAIETREKRVAPKKQNLVRLDGHHALGELEFKSEAFDLRLKTKLLSDALTEQILVKVLLNTLSLMVMGKLKRFEGNVMTWVRASNGKLIDRTFRYLNFLIQKRRLKPLSREALLQLIFETQTVLKPDEAVILKVLTQIPSDQ